jgi:4-hydroxybenzoate polyprenyltransferase
MPPPPLIVNLSGTLVKTDLVLEALVVLIKQNPLYFLFIPFWMCKGKAYLQRQIARRVSLDVSVLPYQSRLLDYLRAQRAHRRPLVLTTTQDERLARQVADHLQLFDMVLGSDGSRPLSADARRDHLLTVFGEKGYDYAGSGRSDLAVWASARKAIVVNSGRHVQSVVSRLAEVERIFEDRPGGFRPYLRALRLHQWVKNLLLFVPLLTTHRMPDLRLMTQASLAFVAFGLCASSVYLLNDLLDLSADRHHPHKRQRPFASGDLSLATALVLIPLLLGLSGLASLVLPAAFLGLLGFYYSATLAYSFMLKHVAPLDVLLLAGLYTARLLAGSAATALWPSPWLLAFTTFLFLSLALVKRYAELVIVVRTVGTEAAKARGYQADDRELITAMGIASGYVAVVVLALYITSMAAQRFHSRQEAIWLLCPLLLYWISYIWLIAHRGGMHDDPVVFALKNGGSMVVIVGMAIIFMIAL